MHEGEEAAWEASRGIRFDGQSWRARIQAGELVLARSIGHGRTEELRWPLESLLRPSFEDKGLAYKGGAFIEVPRGILTCQVGRGLVRLEGQPAELEQAFELIARAARSSSHRTQTTRPRRHQDAPIERFEDALGDWPGPHPATPSRQGPHRGN